VTRNQDTLLSREGPKIFDLTARSAYIARPALSGIVLGAG